MRGIYSFNFSIGSPASRSSTGGLTSNAAMKGSTSRCSYKRMVKRYNPFSLCISPSVRKLDDTFARAVKHGRRHHHPRHIRVDSEVPLPRALRQPGHPNCRRTVVERKCNPWFGAGGAAGTTPTGDRCTRTAGAPPASVA